MDTQELLQAIQATYDALHSPTLTLTPKQEKKMVKQYITLLLQLPTHVY